MTRAELKENLGVALSTLLANKVRSSLTILGIVIGISSVIAVAAIIQGLNRYVSDKVESLGSRTYFITRFPPGTFNFSRLPEHIRQRKYLEYAHARQVAEVSPSVEFVTAFGTRMAVPGMSGSGVNEVTYESQRVERIIVRGVEPEFLQAFPMFAIEQVRGITRTDDAMRAP